MAQYEIPPMSASNMFLMRIFTAFLDLTAPASKNANPHCIRKTTMPMTIRKKLSKLVFSASESKGVVVVEVVVDDMVVELTLSRGSIAPVGDDIFNFLWILHF